MKEALQLTVAQTTCLSKLKPGKREDFEGSRGETEEEGRREGTGDRSTGGHAKLSLRKTGGSSV